MIIEKSELIILILSFGVFIFIAFNRTRLKNIPDYLILMTCFYMIYSAWVFSVVECLFWNGFFNMLEHLCFLGSSVFLTVWFWRVFVRKKSVT